MNYCYDCYLMRDAIRRIQKDLKYSDCCSLNDFCVCLAQNFSGVLQQFAGRRLLLGS